MYIKGIRYLYTYLYTDVPAYTRICTYVEKCMFICVYTYTWVCILCIMHIYIYSLRRVNICMYVCMYAFMYVCMHVCMYVHMCVCMYVCLYISSCMTIHLYAVWVQPLHRSRLGTATAGQGSASISQLKYTTSWDRFPKIVSRVTMGRSRGRPTLLWSHLIFASFLVLWLFSSQPLSRLLNSDYQLPQTAPFELNLPVKARCAAPWRCGYAGTSFAVPASSKCFMYVQV